MMPARLLTRGILERFVYEVPQFGQNSPGVELWTLHLRQTRTGALSEVGVVMVSQLVDFAH
jgi:hypothetical protein